MSDLVIAKSLTLLAGTKKRGRTPERPTITDPRTAPTHCVQFIGSLVKTSGAWRKYSSFYCLLMQDNSFYYRTRCNPCCCKKKYFVFLSISIHMKIIHNSRYDYTELIQLLCNKTRCIFSICAIFASDWGRGSNFSQWSSLNVRKIKIVASTFIWY